MVENVSYTRIDASIPEGVAEKINATFSVICSWEVTGVVEHWGHAHTRVNRYQAVYKVRHQPEGWRIVEAQMLEQSRVDKTSESK